MVKRTLNALLAAAAPSFASAGNALVIDTDPVCAGIVNNGWLGSGQGLTVDATKTHMDDMGICFDAESDGLTFDFELRDLTLGGTILISTSLVVDAFGINVIHVDATLTAGNPVLALIDHNGFSGRTAHFRADAYFRRQLLL